MRKRCLACQKLKNEKEFTLRTDTSKRRNTCKDCERERWNKWYWTSELGRPKHLLQQKLKIKEIEALVREEKNKPCADCGVTYPYYVMDFDHRPEEDKKFLISVAFRFWMSRDRLFEEIAKCDVVCSNCHRFRTFVRQKLKNNEKIPS